jgi:hypothetical protein
MHSVEKMQCADVRADGTHNYNCALTCLIRLEYGLRYEAKGKVVAVLD